MSTEIKCTVSNCDFWKEMKCGAEIVEVDTKNGGMEAGDSRETLCETFKPKGY